MGLQTVLCLALASMGLLPQIELIPLDADWGQWRVAVIVRGETAEGPAPVPNVEISGGRLKSVSEVHTACPGGPGVYLVEAELEEGEPSALMKVAMKGDSGGQAVCSLAPSLSLTEGSWLQSGLCSENSLDEVSAPPANSDGWEEIHLPRCWQETGIQWVRRSFTIPASLRGADIHLHIGAVDDADATFVNGQCVGRTNGWDAPRDYVIPPEAIHWGQANDLCIAVQNAHAGGGIYQAPVVLTAGNAATASSPFADMPTGTERDRQGPGNLGSRLPLRSMSVRDGVLHYEDGGEVCLWGVNYYPQSWTHYRSIKENGLDHKQVIREDFDDLERMGIEVIRIHVFDTEITDGEGNLIRNVHLDLLDYIVAQCNERGIYLMLTPMAWWGSPNERKDSFSHNTPKQAMTMWPGGWPIQANYLTQFLQHTNPYTNHRLVDEPCLALLEIINEPEYWTFGNVRDGDPGRTHLADDVSRRGLEHVRAAWKAFAPDEAWEVPGMYALFRYCTLRDYIDTMVAAMRDAGARQPIAFFRTWWEGDMPEVFRAIADSGCSAVTIGAYPGGLPHEPVNDGVNLLNAAGDWEFETCLAGKARLVYEFDAPGTLHAVHMFPAIARRFRHLGVQVASQFQYDSRALGHLNQDWPQHYLNLRHTPEKAVSFMIAGEVFRRLERGATFDTPEDDQTFGPGAVSFGKNAALLCAEDCYMQARPTDWRPLPLPESPRRVVSVGSCPYFDYDGTGAVFVALRGHEADVEILPDTDRLREGLRGTPEEPLTRLVAREHTFRPLMAEWAEAGMAHYENEAWRPVARTETGFAVVPGRYRLSR